MSTIGFSTGDGSEDGFREIDFGFGLRLDGCFSLELVVGLETGVI